MTRRPLRASGWLSVLLLSACGSTATIDPLERQPKYKAFSPNPFFEDGRAMRTPPLGAVPRERIVQQPGLTTGKDKNGEDLLTNPLPITPEVMKQGRKNFEIRCAVCHGLAGDGVSPVATQMSLRPPPAILRGPHLKAGHVFQVITYGYGVMPSYDYQLTVPERWAVIAYLTALQRSQNATLADAPPDVRAQLMKEAP